MIEISSLARLTDRLHRIEEEVRAVRGDLEKLRRESGAKPEAKDLRLPRVDKAVLRKWAADLFQDLSIEDRSIGALEVQKMTRDSGLEPNELSRSLIRAREE